MTEAEQILKELRDIFRMVERKRNRILSKIDKLPFHPSDKKMAKFEAKERRLRRKLLIWDHLYWWLSEYIESLEEEHKKFNK